MFKKLTVIDLEMLVRQANRKTNYPLSFEMNNENSHGNFWEQLLEELGPYLIKKEQDNANISSRIFNKKEKV
ncbi:hypothetical protein LCGC14_1311510 [marine sediment metagenome]|uniref:Uncharacterized protein n=1 Tax=marine sediment metagenome TaxID=412755 RepID=A0A0F9KM83_9ZZZZ